MEYTNSTQADVSFVTENSGEEWRRRKNTELESLFQNAIVTDVIKKLRLQRADHAWRSQNESIKGNEPFDKRSLGRPPKKKKKKR
jgi:hypothetical protein